MPFAFPVSGDYREELHGQSGLKKVIAAVDAALTIPSHYGRRWTVKRR